MIPLTSVVDFSKLSEIHPLLYVLLVILLLLSAVFSSAETAYSTVSTLRLRNYIDSGKKGAKMALYLVENFENTVSTILIGNNIVNIALTSIASTIFITFILDQSLASLLNTLIVTSVVLVFGEVVPKQFAKSHPETFALKYAAFIYYIRYFFFLFLLLIKPFKKVIKSSTLEENAKLTDEELETFIDDLEEQGVIKEDISDIIQNSLDITEITVEDIMTPRVDMVVLDIESDFETLLKVVKETKYTRIPVFKDDKDNIIGKIHTRDVMLAFMNKCDDEEFDLKSIITEITYIPETMKVNDLIKLMKEKKQHLCVVSGEYGGTEGLVTMEDAFEVVFGEIYDEYDSVPEIDEVIKIDDNKYITSASLRLNELLDELELPEIETQYTSIAGYLSEKLEKIPEIDDFVEESFVIHKSGVKESSIVVILKITVKEIVERRVSKIEVEVYEKSIEELND